MADSLNQKTFLEIMVTLEEQLLLPKQIIAQKLCYLPHMNQLAVLVEKKLNKALKVLEEQMILEMEILVMGVNKVLL